MKVDYVTSYVNGDDREWGVDFLRYFNGSVNWSNSATRFRDWGTLRYSLRGVCKHMPWINNVFVVVADYEEQVPEWLCIDNPRMHIVRHSEFIPKDVLPTYNSNVIDLFLPQIDGLSEHFIYGCDDYVVVRDLNVCDFFLDNGVNVKVEMRNFKDCIYTRSIMNSNAMIDRSLIHKNVDEYVMPYCDHAFVPHLRSYDVNLLIEHASELPSFCSRFRSESDVTWLIFLMNLYSKGMLVSTGVRTKFCGLYKEGDIASLDFSDCDVIVLNDEYRESFCRAKTLLDQRLSFVLPEKCEFER